jgi:hypothetical protein
MSIEEKLKMYRDKKNFVWSVSEAFRKNPRGHSVLEINYEVWHRDHEAFGHCFIEWIIVRFDSGAISPCRVDGNSSTANFRAIGDLIDGGHYEEVLWYKEQQVKLGYKKLDLAHTTIVEVEDENK